MNFAKTKSYIYLLSGLTSVDIFGAYSKNINKKAMNAFKGIVEINFQKMILFVILSLADAGPSAFYRLPNIFKEI